MADTIALDIQQLILQDDHTYSTVDDTQGQMFMVSSNLAYGTVTEHSQKPMPQDDHTYSPVENQQEMVIISGNPAYVTSLRAATGTK